MSSSRPISAVERAFELALSGKFKDIDHLRKQLSREGYDQEQIFGPQLSRQLNEAMQQAKQPKGAPPAS
jgi:hypothetical protein